MKKLILTTELKEAIYDIRLNKKLGYTAGAEVLGVASTVFARWCRELGLNAPPTNGRPRTSSIERRRELQRIWRKNNYKAKQNAAD